MLNFAISRTQAADACVNGFRLYIEIDFINETMKVGTRHESDNSIPEWIYKGGGGRWDLPPNTNGEELKRIFLIKEKKLVSLMRKMKKTKNSDCGNQLDNLVFDIIENASSLTATDPTEYYGRGVINYHIARRDLHLPPCEDEVLAFVERDIAHDHGLAFLGGTEEAVKTILRLLGQAQEEEG